MEQECTILQFTACLRRLHLSKDTLIHLAVERMIQICDFVSLIHQTIIWIIMDVILLREPLQ